MTLQAFDLTRELGHGATGIVYLGRRRSDDRLVAIKVIDPVLAAAPDMARRLEREATAMATVADPHCVAIYDYGIDATGTWIAMEYVEGATLRAVLDAAGSLTTAQACGVLTGALTGLGHAHDVGVLHRDVKPENILVTADGVSKLSDFGLVSGRHESDEWQPMQGTPSYMSPEQVRGAVLDERSDLYSAAAVLYELLTGRPPFVAPTPMAVLHAQVAATPDVDELPDRVGALVRRGLSKDPVERPATAAEFAAELRDAASHDIGPGWLASASIGGLAAGVVAVELARTANGAAAAGTGTARQTRRFARPVVAAAAGLVVVTAIVTTIAIAHFNGHAAAPVRGPGAIALATGEPSTVPTGPTGDNSPVALPASTCQVDHAGTPVAVLTSRELASDIGQPSMTRTNRSALTFRDLEPSATRCVWFGHRIAPTPPYDFQYNVVAQLLIDNRHTPASAHRAFLARKRSGHVAGAPAISGVRAPAFYSTPGPENGNAEIIVLAGQFVLAVDVTAVGGVFGRDPWIPIANTAVANLAVAWPVSS